MRQGGPVIKPASLVKNVGYINGRFEPYKQQDAMSFFRSLLKVIAEEEKRLFGTRTVADVFTGEDVKRITCPNCRHVQQSFHLSTETAISSSQAASFGQRLAAKYATLTVDGLRCQLCEHDKALTLVLAGCRRPVVDCVFVKDFGASKSTLKVDASLESTIGGSTLRHQLLAVVAHEGVDRKSGHFKAFVKAPNGVWHLVGEDEQAA